MGVSGGEKMPGNVVSRAVAPLAAPWHTLVSDLPSRLATAPRAPSMPETHSQPML